MGVVIGIIGPLTRGLSLESVLVNPCPLSGGVGVSSACFGDGMNSMTSTFFSAVSGLWQSFGGLLYRAGVRFLGWVDGFALCRPVPFLAALETSSGVNLQSLWLDYFPLLMR